MFRRAFDMMSYEYKKYEENIDQLDQYKRNHYKKDKFLAHSDADILQVLMKLDKLFNTYHTKKYPLTPEMLALYRDIDRDKDNLVMKMEKEREKDETEEDPFTFRKYF